MTLTKTTQTLVIDRYSRILIPLPPVQSIKDEVEKLVEDEFKIIPEYVETDWCEGYAISWRSWYGFEDCLRYPSMRSFFPFRLKRIIDDWLDEDEDNMQVIEWIDEERWEWLDIERNENEIFHASYWRNNNIVDNVTVYDDSLRVHNNILKTKTIMIQNLRELMKPEFSSLYPIFKVLARRGYWNGIEGRDNFYERIGFDFSQPF